MSDFEFGSVLPKSEEGEALGREINAWLDKVKKSGELEQMTNRWTKGKDSEKVVPNYESLPATKGTLTMATEGAYPPMNYYRDNELVGLEIELAARFCESTGYGLKITPMNFDATLPAVQSGKAYFALAALGFVVFLLCRNGGRIANGISGAPKTKFLRE
ncbi:MAG: transporter substrate-binding domain-containing protein [Atopobiaceae bacterium]|nr:transporter substrate-binding domain-containing protein [Atopobiaceae bacterium]